MLRATKQKARTTARYVREQGMALRAKMRRRRIKARVIGITGSSGKSTSTSLLSHVLEASSSVNQQVLFNSLASINKTLAHTRLQDDYVVVEAGLGQSGGMKPMAVALQPDVAVVTMVALEHKSLYRSVEAIAAEKGHLVEAVKLGGLAILNGDNPLVSDMASRTSARVVTFGEEPHNMYRAANIHASFPDYLSFDVIWGGGQISLQTPFVGRHFWLPVLAAASTALELGVSPGLVAERVASFRPLVDRCGIVAIPDGPTFILDTRKAPQHSLGLAFDVLAQARLRPRRIVLGQISDGRGSSEGQYRKAYKLAREAAEQVIFVGDSSHRANASQQDRDEGRFLEFQTTKQASDYIKQSAVAGELILLKGSSNLHLERIAMRWLTELHCWEAECGLRKPCFRCGQYGKPFETHKGRKRSDQRSNDHVWRSLDALPKVS